MPSLEHEPQLHALAIEVFGTEGFTDWLCEQFRQCPDLHDQFRGDAWLVLDKGPLLNRIWSMGKMPGFVLKGDTAKRMMIDECQQHLFNALLQTLPLDRLTEPLLEQRLQLDMGI